MLDLVTIGHFALDLIFSLKIANPTVTLGGPPTFFSLAANKLGAKVGVVSKVGEDFLEHLMWLRKNGVDVSHVKVVKDAPTTSFALTYDNSRRQLQLRKKAPQIFLKDIPTSPRAKAIHVAPVADELSAEVLEKLRNRTPLLSIDPQGFLREFDERGYAKPRRLDDISFLQHCDVFKSSFEEAKTMTGCSKLGVSMEKIGEFGVKIVLVTMGRKGVVARFNGDFYHVPACIPQALKDTTGAGDAFIGGFLATYIRNEEPLWCCCVGSAAASFVVEGIGSERFGERDEVYDRATKIYEKGIKPLPRDAVA